MAGLDYKASLCLERGKSSPGDNLSNVDNIHVE